MLHSIHISSVLKTGLRQLGVAIIYAILVWGSLVYFSPGRAAGIFLFANGFALAAVLLFPRYIVAIFLGALTTHCLLGYSAEAILLLSLGSALGPYLGARLLLRDKVFDITLATARDYVLLIVYGGFIGSAISVGIGAMDLLSVGILAHEVQPKSLLALWLGGVLSVMLVTPLILLWARPAKVAFQKQKSIEVMAVITISFVAGQVVFFGWFATVIGHMGQGYWMALPILWAAMRLDKRWLILLLVMIALQALLGAYWAGSLFAQTLAANQLGNYCLFMASLALAGMLLGIYIERHRQNEIKVQQQADELHFRNQILQQINQGTSLSKGLSAITQEFERLNPGSRCAILLLDKEGKHLRFGAASSLPDFYRQAINGLPVGEGVGVSGAAVHRGEPVIIADMQKYSFWPVGFRFRDAAKKAGIQSCWSQPIKNSGHRILGTLDIYHEIKCQPSPVEMRRMEYMAHLAAQVIDQAKIQAILHLKSLAFNAAANAMAITDKGARIQWVNPAFSEMAGYPAKELIGLTLSEFGRSEKQDPAYYQTIWKSILAGNAWHGELLQRHKDGADYDQEMTITPMKSVAGDVSHFIAVMRDITERKKSEEQIRTLAFYDTLTQLPNRRLLEDRLSRALIVSKRSNRYGALMFLDLDNFKPLNDKYGHGTGDQLLTEVAQRVTQCIRGTDTVARFGGDEFVVMLDGLDAGRNESIAEAEIVAEKIRRAIAEPFRVTIHKEGRGEVSTEHRCSASIGVALFIGDSVSSDDLLKRADMAMYRAKDKGRNRAHFFDARHA